MEQLESLLGYDTADQDYSIISTLTPEAIAGSAGLQLLPRLCTEDRARTQWAQGTFCTFLGFRCG